MADMSDILKNFAQMMNSNSSDTQKNDETTTSGQNSSNASFQSTLDELMRNFSQSSNNSSENPSAENFQNNNASFDFSNIDMDIMMKFGKIMSAMQSPQNNNGANLLRSLKPYLNPSRQQKVDQYIQLLNLENVMNVMNNLGGDKRNDS